ncbi:MAG: aspartate/glutamate racemase family protein [Thermoplasmata archaeon]|nr:aspartate/glutamate racemase family protein [Thermoplasmata archaeon]
MSFRILDLIPVVMSDSLQNTLLDRKNLGEEIKRKSNGAIELEIISLSKGSSSLEYSYDEVYSGPYILQKVKWAEEKGFNAVVIDCFFDPMLDAAREIVSIPVIGPCESSLKIASQLAHKFSIISPTPSGNRIVWENIEKYHMERKIASIRFLDFEVLELESREEDVRERLLKESKKAILEDDAGAIVMGCTGMSTFANFLQKALKKELGYYIPMIEPLRAAVFNAINIVLMGVTHSRKTYAYPSEKRRIADWEDG